jgi:hypothetical protein
MACIRVCEEVTEMALGFRNKKEEISLCCTKLLSARLKIFRAACMDACKKIKKRGNKNESFKE